MVNSAEDGNHFPDSGLERTDDSVITARDSHVLQAVQEEGLTVFTFDGLKRLLGVHQEMLSRILSRLEEESLVERVPEGYRVTAKAKEQFPRRLSSGPARIPIVQSLLPQDTEMKRILSGLKGRWFGSLRWLGYSQNDDGAVLKWITEDDGIQLDAKFTDNFLSIEAKIGHGNDVSHAVKASHQLLGYISRLYDGPRRARSFVTQVGLFTDMGFA